MSSIKEGLNSDWFPEEPEGQLECEDMFPSCFGKRITKWKLRATGANNAGSEFLLWCLLCEFGHILTYSCNLGCEDKISAQKKNVEKIIEEQNTGKLKPQWNVVSV